MLNALLPTTADLISIAKPAFAVSSIAFVSVAGMVFWPFKQKPPQKTAHGNLTADLMRATERREVAISEARKAVRARDLDAAHIAFLVVDRYERIIAELNDELTSRAMHHHPDVLLRERAGPTTILLGMDMDFDGTRDGY